MSSVVGFSLLHSLVKVLSSQGHSCSFLSDWMHILLLDGQRQYGKAQRDARLMSDCTLKMWKRSAATAGELNRLTSLQQLCLPPLSSPAGIRTMSAITRPRESQQRFRHAAQRKQRGGRGERRAREVWHGENRRQKDEEEGWKKTKGQKVRSQ